MTQALAEPVDCAARMADHAGAWRALPPGTATRLKLAFSGGDPALYLWEGALVCDEIDAIVCTEEEGQGTCAHLLLTDPDRGCRGAAAGPYCAVWEEDKAPAELRAPILARLEERAPRDVWRSVEKSQSAAQVGSSGPRAEPDLWPMIASVFALLLLVVLGLRLGALPMGPLTVRVAAPIALTFACAWLWPTVSTWDVLGSGGLISLAAWIGGRERRATRRGWTMAGGMALGTLALAEVVVRVALPSPPAMPPPQQARLFFEPEAREDACLALFPGQYPDTLPGPSASAERVVLHLGDSMVFGTGVAPPSRFTNLLDQSTEETAHLNAGFPGTGPDHHLRVLQGWIPRVEPQAVVLYLYPGNDLVDLDRPYACCDHGPLLDRAFTSRCTTPAWSFPLLSLLARSPAPYPIRAASSHLALAGHLGAAFGRLTSLLEPRLGGVAGSEERESAWGRYAGTLAAIRETARRHGVTLTAVLLPTRVALEPGAAPSHAAVVSDRMARVVKQESIQLLDARPLFASQGRDGTYAHLFGDGENWDEHLSLEGHKLLAQWLEERL